MNIPHVLRELQQLVWVNLVSVNGVLAVIGIERCHSSALMAVIVVSKFGRVDEVRPIVLMIQAKHAQVGFQPLVVTLDLSLSLWVVCC